MVSFFYLANNTKDTRKKFSFYFCHRSGAWSYQTPNL